jgi:hypothetical protein
MVGSVKKLNTASSYSIKTPVGAAGIRGTVYRIVFQRLPNEKAFFTVSTAEGKVVMQDVTESEIPIEAGKEVEVQVNTDDPSHPQIKTHDLSDAAKVLIGQAAQTITEALAEIVIPSGGGTPPPGGPPPPNDTTNAVPDLTPGAGESH